MDWIREINNQIDIETASSQHCSQLILGVSVYEILKEHLKIERTGQVETYRGLEVICDYSISSHYICVIPF